MDWRKEDDRTNTRKIILTRSEPLMNLKRLRELSGFNAVQNALFTRDYGASFSSSRKMVHPPTSARSKITIVSPKRRVRIPQPPSLPIYNYPRTNADGESAYSTDNEKVLKVRVPGDGCNSVDSEVDNTESDLSFTNSESILGVDSFNKSKYELEGNFDKESEGSHAKDIEDEYYDVDDDDTDLENDTCEDDKCAKPGEYSSDSSISESDLEEEQKKISSLDSATSFRLKLSKCSLKEESPLPLLKSLFVNKPPTLYFTTQEEQVCQLPLDIRKILKWKVSSVTPKVIKMCIAKTGFRLTKKNSEWLGVWGKHMKPASFKAINPYQKINHFPGTFHIGRKDKLWRNFCKMKIAYGKQDFNFVPQTYVLPHDLNQLKKVWDEAITRNKWIIKPPASARGTGIKVIHKWSQVPKKRPVVVQRYLTKPYLINGHKFDLRIYVYVTSFDPLRVYIFEDGLVRFATSKYSSSSKSLSNRYMHLTNYSINKKNTSVYTSNNDSLDDSKKSFKWSLKELWKYLHSKGINSNKIWDSIKDIAVKSILCGESNINTLIKQNISNRLSCHELFGLDIILDSKMKPWLLEVNISPSLHSNSDLDKKIKGQLVKDILNMTGFFLPRHLLLSNSGRCANIDEIAAERFWFDSRTLSSDEKAKHTFYVQRHDDFRTRSSILDVLTPDDVLMIMETEDEFSRSGSFERLLPTCQQKNYLKFIQTPRYYNVLLEEWTKQYMRDAVRSSIGVRLIQSLAETGLHLSDSTTVHPQHQWLYNGPRSHTNRQMLSASQLPTLSRRRLSQSMSTTSSHLYSQSYNRRKPSNNKKQ